MNLSSYTSYMSNYKSATKAKSDSKKDKGPTRPSTLLDGSKQRTPIISASGSPTLRKITNLRSRTTTNSISPEQAALVVKDYILPLFRLERSSKEAKRRSETYSAKPSLSKDSSILSGFRLVDDLNAKLQATKETNKTIEDKLKLANQDKYFYENEYKRLNDQLLNSEGNLTFANFIHTQSLKKINQEKFGSLMLNDQVCKYKSLYEDEVKNSLGLAKALEDERSNMDKVKGASAKLEYINTLLVMENDILGEKLKGLYIALTNVVGKSGVSPKIVEEYQIITQNSCRLSKIFTEDMKRIDHISEEKKELEVMVKELSDITLGIQGRKDKYIKMLREKISKLESDLKLANINKEKQKNDIDVLERKLQDLHAEHVKLRTKVKTNKKQFNQSLLEEKYCKNCQEPFTEAINFNWSCKVHSSSYNEGVYWCCGQSGKNSQGCLLAKHISNEDASIDKEVSDQEDALFCSSCRNQGHIASECPRDPNTRSNFDPSEELRRIKENKKKKKLNSESYSIKRKFINMVINRIKNSQIYSELQKTHEKQNEKSGFADIARYKQQFINTHGDDIHKLIEDLQHL